MSMSYPTGPGSGSGSHGSPSSNIPSAPTPTPLTVFPTPSPSTDTASPSVVSFPPTAASSETEAPSSNPVEFSLFECSDQGLVLPAGTPAAVTTPLSLAVYYEVESMSNTTDVFLSDLQLALYSIALTAALDCGGTQRRELQLVTMRRQLTASTTEVGTYNECILVDLY